MMGHVAHLESVRPLAEMTLRGHAANLPMIQTQADLHIKGHSHQFSSG